MEKFRNRHHAGKVLAEELKAYAYNPKVIVLGLPRGGVPVAYEIAKALEVPLDVFIVRKLGVPGHEELAMGAIASGDVTVFNERVLKEIEISKFMVDQVIQLEQQELKRREQLYRGEHQFPVLKGKIIILVDDGIATGATMRAAIKALQKQKPKKIIIAVPVAALSTCKEMEPLVDIMICPQKPELFYAVGAWYEDFSQTEDEEVSSLLNSRRGK
jgi:putative phosphoribosyl transferase